jgi:hypothetical protein
MPDPDQVWELLGIRQLAATDERAEEFTGTIVVHRPGHAEPVETVRLVVKRQALEELTGYLTRLLKRSRGLSR